MTIVRAKRETWLYRLRDDDGRLLYVGISYDCDMRIRSHRKKRWGPTISSASVVKYPDRVSALAAEARAIRNESPLYNVAENETNPEPMREWHQVLSRFPGLREAIRNLPGRTWSEVWAAGVQLLHDRLVEHDERKGDLARIDDLILSWIDYIEPIYSGERPPTPKAARWEYRAALDALEVTLDGWVKQGQLEAEDPS